MLQQPQLQSKIAFSEAFILLKPDVFYRGLLAQILHFLKAYDLSILCYLAGKVSESHYKLMYASDFCWDVDDWHHNRKLYTFGPALGLVLRSEKSENLQHFLSELKGSALPKNRKEGSLRKHFQSKSRIFNLIHVPDRHDQAAQEASYWFGTTKLPKAAVSFEAVTEEIALARYCEETKTALDPEDTFLKAKIRLLHALKNKGNIPEPLSVLFCQANHFYHQWSIEALNTTECNGIEGTILPEWQKKEKTLLEGMVQACQEDPKRLKALKVLTDLKTCYKFPSNFFWILDEWDVYLSELEQYLVLSRLKYNYHPSSE